MAFVVISGHFAPLVNCVYIEAYVVKNQWYEDVFQVQMLPSNSELPVGASISPAPGLFFLSDLID